MESRTQYILDAFADLRQRIAEHAPFDQQELAEEEVDFLTSWDELTTNIKNGSHDYSFDAQEVLSRFIRCYANLVPLIKRELLWFVGGECLHFLGDEEIALYQQLEEHLYELDRQNKHYDIAKEIDALRSTPTQIH
ncbi:PA2817 family protein [Marinomonas shanghaiensis]|uniref:PA2817 family protein n=1 Tax=Marinomonas shanghaiensis TaxID=2202418 RepID=UPI000DB964BF|nr:PA2817 family protein [Marinomonas shanghaiensis]